MNKPTLLRRIAGRIKKYMNLTTLAVSLVAIFLPTAVYLLVEGREADRPIAFAIFITALLLLITSLIRVYREGERDKTEKAEQREEEAKRFETISLLLVSIKHELSKLNEKKGKNNGDTKNSDTPL